MKDRLNFRIPMFTDKGSFLEFQYIYLGDEIECTLCGYNGEAEQCTGLKDKNGKLIYEGDIVTFDKELRKGIIKYYTNYCWFFVEVEKSKWARPFNNIPDRQYLEVIGNIHQNKELLELLEK